MADKTQVTLSNTDLTNETLTGKLPYTLTNDFFFKAFLQRNEMALRGLLSALLSVQPEEIKSITITNPIKEGELVDDKSVILDINLVLNDNQIINLEMQVANLGNWPERSLTYLCRMFDHLKAGEDYIHVKKTVHIGIMDFTPNGFPKTNYYSRPFSLHSENPAQNQCRTPQNQWLSFSSYREEQPAQLPATK